MTEMMILMSFDLAAVERPLMATFYSIETPKKRSRLMAIRHYTESSFNRRPARL